MIDWLTGTLIATSLLMALVLLVREPVRRQFGPAAAYGLWLIPAIRLFMPPLTETVERIIPAPSSLSLITLAATPAADPTLIDRVDWHTLALSAWISGAVLMLIGGLLLYRWQRREVLRDGVPLARLDGIRIVRSPDVRGPMAFGLFDKVVALPIDFDDRYDPAERRLAFEYELSTTDPATSSLAISPSPYSARSGSTRSPGSPTPRSASTRKQHAMPGFSTRRAAATAPPMRKPSPRPLRDGRFCSQARSTDHALCTGDWHPC